MYQQSGISSGFGNLDLGKTANAILSRSFDFLERVLGYVSELSVISSSFSIIIISFRSSSLSP